MGLYVSRREDGSIWSRSAIEQFEGQEYLEDGAPDLVALELRDAKADKVTAINAAFDAEIAAGFSYAGKVIDLDEASRANIAAAATRAMAVALALPGMAWPDGFAWRTKDNTTLDLDPSEMLGMGQEAADRFTALILIRGALKDAVAAATSAEELEAVDPAAGWN